MTHTGVSLLTTFLSWAGATTTCCLSYCSYFFLFNISSAKLHIFFQYANFFAIIFSFSSSLLAFTLLYRNAHVWVRSLLARAPHVLWLARPFNNLPNLLHKYSFYCINIQNGSVSRYAGNHSLKAWVSRCKTKGFRVRNQGFQDVKPRVLQTRGINFEKCKQCSCFCLQIITIFTFVKLKIAVSLFCIFMQFLGMRGCQDNIL